MEQLDSEQRLPEAVENKPMPESASAEQEDTEEKKRLLLQKYGWIPGIEKLTIHCDPGEPKA
ncbi:MAG: hypothetical protein LBM74_07060 [Oscillospiraceae bacterium]|nr:hypothetical protein [Oscillospiraceae bacterium]